MDQTQDFHPGDQNCNVRGSTPAQGTFLFSMLMVTIKNAKLKFENNHGHGLKKMTSNCWLEAGNDQLSPMFKSDVLISLSLFNLVT